MHYIVDWFCDSVKCLSQLQHNQCTLPRAAVHCCRNCSAHISSWFQNPWQTFIIVTTSSPTYNLIHRIVKVLVINSSEDGNSLENAVSVVAWKIGVEIAALQSTQCHIYDSSIQVINCCSVNWKMNMFNVKT